MSDNGNSSAPRPFVHLHLHSEYSLLDGANRIGPLADRVKALGMPSCALTDHGVMFGAVDFYKAMKDRGVAPIIGCEVYVCPTGRHDKSPSSQANHLVLLSTNVQGYINLCKLTSLAHKEGFYRKPRIDHELLSHYNEGLIALSACLKGEVADALIKNSEHAARAIAGKYKDIFGPERFFLEIQDHGIDLQHKVVRFVRGVSKDLGLKVVATNDAHYLTKDSSDAHDCLMCIGTGKLLSDPKRMRYNPGAFYVTTAEEMYQKFAEWEEPVAFTADVAAMCRSEIPFKNKLYPKYPLPEGVVAKDFLRERVKEGLTKRYKDPVPKAILDRADFELSVIERTGFVDYFLVVWDFIKYSRDRGIPVGPGRGSGAGSVVAYALWITDVDPIEHGLLFERFLNPERVSAPDFDIDFCFERRGEVIEYVRHKYGRDNVANIITFGTLKPKAAIRDVGRVLEMPLSRVDQIAKMVPEGPSAPKDLKHAIDEVPELKSAYGTDADVKRLIDLAKGIEGTSRHASVHAAGIVIADKDLSGIVPIYKASNSDDFVVSYTMSTVEELGLLKMDFLGLKNLTIIDRACQDIERATGRKIDWGEIPLNEPKTYEFLRTGRTDGIFQLESPGMKDVVRRLKPERFDEISAILALYRPGPMESGMIEEFVECKHGRREVAYDHPWLEPVLKETYGAIIYQEQVMQIAQVIAGYSLGGADLLRRAMGKKKKEAMDVERPKFVAGCSSKGIDEALATRIFDKMEKFAGYGFNKSHSIAYAAITFRTAYLKAHYPVAYNAALLTNEIDGGKADEKIPAYMLGCREAGIPVLPPDVNESQANFAVAGAQLDEIRFGLAAIKNVGRPAVDAIVVEREKRGPFRSLQDFCERVTPQAINSRTVESLIRAGAFDSLHSNRKALLAGMEAALELGNMLHREEAGDQVNLFEKGKTEVAKASRSAIEGEPDFTDEEKLKIEKELIGFYVSGHPLDAWRADIESFAQVKANTLAETPNNQSARMIGMVTDVVRRTSAAGKPYAFLQMEDFTGQFEVAVWGKTYEKYNLTLEKGKPVAIIGKISTDGRAAKIIAEEILAPDVLRRKLAKFIDLRLDASKLTATTLAQLVQTIERCKGTAPLPCRLLVRDGDGAEILVEPEKRRLLKFEPNNDALQLLAKSPMKPMLRLAER